VDLVSFPHHMAVRLQNHYCLWQ